MGLGGRRGGILVKLGHMQGVSWVVGASCLGSEAAWKTLPVVFSDEEARERELGTSLISCALSRSDTAGSPGEDAVSRAGFWAARAGQSTRLQRGRP